MWMGSYWCPQSRVCVCLSVLISHMLFVLCIVGRAGVEGDGGWSASAVLSGYAWTEQRLQIPGQLHNTLALTLAPALALTLAPALAPALTLALVLVLVLALALALTLALTLTLALALALALTLTLTLQ